MDLIPPSFLGRGNYLFILYINPFRPKDKTDFLFCLYSFFIFYRFTYPKFVYAFTILNMSIVMSNLNVSPVKENLNTLCYDPLNWKLSQLILEATKEYSFFKNTS